VTAPGTGLVPVVEEERRIADLVRLPLGGTGQQVGVAWTRAAAAADARRS
jgi:hypothetical protein